jgi:outer membrane protein assembly factor BamB
MAQAPAVRGSVRWWNLAAFLSLAAFAACGVAAVADDPVAEVAEDDGGVFLPTDRGRERQLDRGRRLVADERWTDAAMLLDELLADDRDAFAQGDGAAATRCSIRSEAARLVRQLPPAGRDAYDTLFRARAARVLAEAVANDDVDAIAAVARRWFETPSGREAALLAAVTALESNQPLAASSWLERLAGVPEAQRFEPTLSLMRAAAWELAGEPGTADGLVRAARGTVRVAGRDVRLSAAGADDLRGWLAGRRAAERTAREWRQPRGDPARNAICDASGPLLVPRYRVPLTSHPEEARLLGRRRRALAAGGNLVMPAGTPLAVAGMIVVQTPLGVLAVDFETGKRSWLQSVFPAPAGDAPVGHGGRMMLDRVFDDATSGGLSSDGRLVFAVESHPDSLTPAAHHDLEARAGQAGGWRGGNVLSAYDLRERGMVRWRRAEKPPSPVWHLGAPLVVGEKLFVLVEEQDQVRLDVLDAESGRVEWSQPLADRDGERSAATADGFFRRRAGLTPAFGEGVLVCPLGDGVVVALDVATRSLLWAHTYRRAADRIADGAFGDAGVDDAALPDSPAGDPCPIIASGRVLLAPGDSDELLCLGLRDGAAAWPERPRRGLRVAGVVDGRVVCLGRAGVEALDAATGRRLWQRPYPANAHPCGRGILTAERLLLPLDSPEVLELAVADGAELARRPARGQATPGNLVAYRGEIVSRGIDSLDVFHQVGALETRIETASRSAVDDPWAAYWHAHLEIEGGDIAAGLERLRAAATRRAPPQTLADALVHGMRRDFRTAAGAWRSWADAADPAATAPQVMRTAVDNFLRLGDTVSAWRACRQLIDATPSSAAPVNDPSDPVLEVDPDCWIRGRIAELAARADEPLRREIAATLAGVVAAAVAEPDPAARLRRLQSMVARLGPHPAAATANDALVAEIDRRLKAAGGVSQALLTRRQLIEMAPGTTAEYGGEAARDDVWPFGRVDVGRGRAENEPEIALARGPIVSVPLATAGARPGLTATYDVQHRRLSIADPYGRRVADPLPVDVGRSSSAIPWHDQGIAIEPSLVGRLLFVRTTTSVTAFDLAAGPAAARVLWRHVRPPEAGVAGAVVRLAQPSGRVARDRGIALGRKITEPNDLSVRSSAAGVPARVGGVLGCGQRSVTMLDPATGRVLWERQGLPPGLEWEGDDEFLCGCTADGRGSLVLSARDGRVLHAADVPHRRQRLATHGRRLVAIVPLDDAPVATRVRIDIVDPVDRESRPLGEFAGESRATLVADGRLAVVEPGGRLGVFDLTDGATLLTAVLPDAPARTEYLHVMPWEDRYLVFAGIGGPGLEDEPRGVSALHELAGAGEATPPLSGTVWAVDRRDGRLLWPTPATVERQCLQTNVPDAVPLLVFCRRMRPGAGHDQPHVSLLCLDKRTGRAVLADERVAAQPQLSFRCDVVGDPAAGSVTIGAGGGLVRPIVLRFTAAPIPPGPPFRARSRPPEPGRGLDSFADTLEESRAISVPGQ